MDKMSKEFSKDKPSQRSLILPMKFLYNESHYLTYCLILVFLCSFFYSFFEFFL